MTKITPANVDALLDSGRLEVAMRSGKWWQLRRNGATKRWKTDPLRVTVIDWLIHMVFIAVLLALVYAPI